MKRYSLLLFLLQVLLFMSCKNYKDSINYENWVKGKNFEYVLKETKDSIIIGDYMLNGTVISFISKDSLLFANNIDGWFF